MKALVLSAGGLAGWGAGVVLALGALLGRYDSPATAVEWLRSFV